MRNTFFRLTVVAICLSLFMGANTATAQVKRIKVSGKQASNISLRPDFNQFGLQAACLTNKKKIKVGIVRNNRFIHPPGKALRKSLRRSMKPARARKVAKTQVRSLRQSCKNAVRTAQPGGSAGNNNTAKNPSFRAPAIPNLAKWESQMTQWGQVHCNNLRSSSFGADPKLASTYYDSLWIFYKIADYTRDNSWLSCVQAARNVYRDNYVLRHNGEVPGFWNFSHGVARDFLSTGDDRSRQAVNLLATNGMYARASTPLSETQSTEMSREVAYAIMAYLNAEDLGARENPRLRPLVEQAFGHFDEWFNSGRAPYIRPFMVALSSQALIMYHEKTGDKRVIPVLSQAADWLWDNTWVESERSFQYTDRNTSHGGREVSHDLNLLIAPVYAWLYHQTGQARFQQRGDKIFAGGVDAGWLSNGKQYNQSYRWSFEYVRWRLAKPLR